MLKKLVSLFMSAAMVFALAAAVPERGGIIFINELVAEAFSGTTRYTSSLDTYPKYNDTAHKQRSCTSVAWECVYYNSNIKLYGYLGNGKYWFGNAKNRGYKTYTSTPSPGHVACFGNDTINPATGKPRYGHVAYILSVNTSNQTMTLYEGGYGYGTANSDNCGVKTSYNVSYKIGSYRDGSSNYLQGFIDPGIGSQSTVPKGHVMTEAEAAGQTIPNGDYWISSGIDQRYFVDIPGDRAVTSNDDGLNVQMWTWGNDMPTQYDVFHFEYLNNGFYRISQRGSNLSLDVKSASLERGANVQIWTLNNSNAQQWSVEKTSKGYKLRARCSSFYLDVSGGTVANYTNVQVWEGNTANAQLFGLIPYNPDNRPIADGTYYLSSALKEGLYLDIAGVPGGFKNGSNAQVWNSNDDSFKVEYAGDGYYTIKEATSGITLEITNPGTAHLEVSKNAQLYTVSVSRGIYWYPYKNADGTYTLFNKLSGYALDVAAGGTADGTNCASYYYNGTNAQKWSFIPTSLAGDANEDGKVSVADVLLMQQYLAKWSVTINKTNANVNADTAVTVADVLLLQQYLAKWNVTLKTGEVLDGLENIKVGITDPVSDTPVIGKIE